MTLLRRQALPLLMAACGGLGAWGASQAADNTVLVIGHAALPRIDVANVQRLYTGRSVEVAGISVTAVNAAPGSALRQRFLALVLQQDEDQYRAYWTVRRHVGKGVPPRELASTAELISFVQATPGAVAYIDAADLRPGLNVLTRP